MRWECETQIVVDARIVKVSTPLSIPWSNSKNICWRLSSWMMMPGRGLKIIERLTNRSSFSSGISIKPVDYPAVWVFPNRHCQYVGYVLQQPQQPF